jgi:hypothetical protein
MRLGRLPRPSAKVPCGRNLDTGCSAEAGAPLGVSLSAKTHATKAQVSKAVGHNALRADRQRQGSSRSGYFRAAPSIPASR